MEGVTHPGYRDLMASYGGIGVVCTEFVRITRGPVNRRLVKHQVVASEHAGVNTNLLAPGDFIDAISNNAAVNGIPVTIAPV